MDPGLFMAPAIIFVTFVAPIWVIMHYRAKGRASSALTEDERTQLERLSEAAAGMRERIETLESILDAETPEWRGRVRDTRTRSDNGHD